MLDMKSHTHNLKEVSYWSNRFWPAVTNHYYRETTHCDMSDNFPVYIIGVLFNHGDYNGWLLVIVQVIHSIGNNATF